jgi:hypothetical protein
MTVAENIKQKNYMAKQVEIKGQIQVNAETFRKWQRVQAGVNAAKKRADALKAELGIPAASAKTEGAWLIVDGNNAPIGKVSVFYKGAFLMPETWQARVS